MNPRKLQPFIKADEIRMKRKNHELWLQGRYFYEAVSVAISGAMSRNNRSKYPDKPYEMNLNNEENKQQNIDQAKAMFMAFAQGIKNKGD